MPPTTDTTTPAGTTGTAGTADTDTASAASGAPQTSSSAAATSSPPAASAPSAAVPFTLYALRGRVVASNVKGKLVDLGHLSRDGEGGTYTYRLDGDQSTGSGFADVQAALAHIAETTTFLFLDGQFTALQDLGGADRPDLAGAPQRQIALEPPGAATGPAA